MALQVTFLISAIWHGVHPVYFVGFIQWAIILEDTKYIYKAREKFSWIPKNLQIVIVWILS